MSQSPAATVNERSSGPAASQVSPPTSSSAAGRQSDRQLGDRVRSLSLSRLPERRNSLLTGGIWVLTLAAISIGLWYGYSHYLSAKTAAQPTADAGRNDGSHNNTG